MSGFGKRQPQPRLREVLSKGMSSLVTNDVFHTDEPFVLCGAIKNYALNRTARKRMTIVSNSHLCLSIRRSSVFSDVIVETVNINLELLDRYT